MLYNNTPLWWDSYTSLTKFYDLTLPALPSELTFSRASAAYQYDSTGTLVWAPMNLALYSGTFSSGYTNVASTKGTSAVLAPDGVSTLVTLTDTTANSRHIIYNLTLSVTSVYTWSIYLKAGTARYAQVQLSLPSSTYGVVFDLLGGTATDTKSSGSPTNTGYSIQALANGIYRCSVQINSASAGQNLYGIVALSNSATPSYDANNNPTYTGSGTNAIYIWGAQLEYTSYNSPQTYNPTTSAAYYGPRLQDYNPSTLAVNGLAIEAGMTNLLSNSNSMSNATYWTQSNTTTTSSGTGPNGIANSANFVVPSTSSAIHRLAVVGLTISNSTKYVSSVYAKAGGYRYLYFNGGAGVNQGQVCFDLQTGTIAATSTGTGTIQKLPNGWYRCSVAGTSSSTSYSCFFQVNDTGVASDRTFAGDGTSGIYLYGAQLEVDIIASSYIPTSSATVTRAADQLKNTSISSWYNATNGTFIVKALYAGANNHYPTYGTFSDGTTANFMSMTNLPTGAPYGQTSISSTQLTSGYAASASPLSSITVGTSYISGNFNFSYNGTLYNGATGYNGSGVPSGINTLWLGAGGAGATVFQGWLKSFAYYNTNLTTTQLNTLTGQY